MKSIYIAMVLIFVLATGGWAADEGFSGRVVALDRTAKRMVALPFRSGHHGRGGMHGRHMGGHMQNMGGHMGKERGVEIRFIGKKIPGFVRLGDVVRFKGQFQGQNRFLAREILEFRNPDTDPTGVRHRIMDHCREMP
ncbi:MAG: hypothetical protein MI747_08110 [Desulfobacterales bacterium]|nr:hypothetical protein [Desulfobacterales bacterium]